MKKIFQLLGKAAPVKGDVGIEIEAEGKGMRVVDTEVWKTEADGSLRGDFPERSAEFVLRKPIMHAAVDDALKSLREELDGAVFNFSFRTSVHIHINVQDMTEVELMNYIYLYLLLEEPLVNFCGRERKGNRFCLRLVDAEGMLEYLTEGFHKGIKQVMNYDPNAIRYSSLNLASIKKYGSLEFRAMRGTMDGDTLKIWIDTLYGLKKQALQYKDPKKISEEFQQLGAAAFYNKVLGDNAQHFIYPRMVREMQRSYSLSIDLPYAYKEPVEEAIIPPEFGLNFREIWPELNHINVSGHRVNDGWIEVQLAGDPHWHQYTRATKDLIERVENNPMPAIKPKAPARPRAPRVVVRPDQENF